MYGDVTIWVEQRINYISERYFRQSLRLMLILCQSLTVSMCAAASGHLGMTT